MHSNRVPSIPTICLVLITTAQDSTLPQEPCALSISSWPFPAIKIDILNMVNLMRTLWSRLLLFRIIT